MMDCVLTAYKSHLCYLGITYNRIDETVYHFIKARTHSTIPSYTYGGIVPLILSTMAFLGHGLNIEIEHSIWTQYHYLSFAAKEEMSVLMKFGIMAGNFGKKVEKITLEPAIYLMYDMAHAIFSPHVPHSGIPIVAVKILDTHERSTTYDSRYSTNYHPAS